MLRTNARGRHTYVPAFKQWIVEQARLPGMSVAGLALSNQVNANQLRRWMQLGGAQPPATSVLAQPSTSATLLPVTVAPPRAVSSTVRCGPPVEVELAGVIVRVPDGVTPATLRLVLECLRTTP